MERDESNSQERYQFLGSSNSIYGGMVVVGVMIATMAFFGSFSFWLGMFIRGPVTAIECAAFWGFGVLCGRISNLWRKS